jgi:hypothetical protein
MVRSRSGIIKAVSTAAVAAVAGWLTLGCAVEEDISGDWMMYSQSSDGNIYYYSDDDIPDRREIMSFKPSGEASAWGFRKVGEFWVENPFGSGEIVKWRTEGGSIYIDTGDYHEREWATYTISGDWLTTTRCYDSSQNGRRCIETEFTKVDVDSIRESLGTVYTNEAKLYKSAAYDDLIWYSQGENRGYIDFSSYQVWGSGLYSYIDDRRGGIYYYTDGGKLFLVNQLCDWDDNNVRYCKVLETVDLKYSIIGSGRNAKLNIEDDVWLPAEYGEYNQGPAKPKLGKRQSGRNNGDNFFISLTGKKR